MEFTHQDDSTAFMRLLGRASSIPEPMRKEEEEVYRKLEENGKLSRQAVKILLNTLHGKAQDK